MRDFARKFAGSNVQPSQLSFPLLAQALKALKYPELRPLQKRVALSMAVAHAHAILMATPKLGAASAAGLPPYRETAFCRYLTTEFFGKSLSNNFQGSELASLPKDSDVGASARTARIARFSSREEMSSLQYLHQQVGCLAQKHNSTCWIFAFRVDFHGIIFTYLFH